MTNEELIQSFNIRVAEWLTAISDPEEEYDSGLFELDGVEFELQYDGEKYRVLCEGVEVAWNDNSRDFREVGSFLLATNRDDGKTRIDEIFDI